MKQKAHPRKSQSKASLTQRYAGPFAKALAVFVRELERDRSTPLDPSTKGANSLSEGPELVISLDQRPLATRAIADARRRLNEGRLETWPLTATIEGQAANRLQHLLKLKGMTQAALARKLGVSPAVVNRVLKRPDRSMVATLRRIAAALHAELWEIID
jgi:lambda repressor-like predicted transcriptional regulator